MYQQAQRQRRHVVTYGWAYQGLGHTGYNLLGTRRLQKKYKKFNLFLKGMRMSSRSYISQFWCHQHLKLLHILWTTFARCDKIKQNKNIKTQLIFISLKLGDISSQVLQTHFQGIQIIERKSLFQVKEKPTQPMLPTENQHSKKHYKHANLSLKIIALYMTVLKYVVQQYYFFITIYLLFPCIYKV